MSSDEVKDIYNKIARKYHEKRKNITHSTWNDYLEMPAINSLLEPNVKNKHVLDLGCGTGFLTVKLTQWGAHVIGVDHSEEMLMIAREENPDLEFLTASAHSLPFNDKSFDLIASSLVLHYFENLTPIFKEISRVLKDNGRFVFSMHHPFNNNFNVKKEPTGMQVTALPYFNSDKYYWKMCDEKIPSYHQTFEVIFNSAKDAGFIFTNLIETKPDKRHKADWDSYEYTSTYPTFLVIEAVKYGLNS